VFLILFLFIYFLEMQDELFIPKLGNQKFPIPTELSQIENNLNTNIYQKGMFQLNTNTY